MKKIVIISASIALIMFGFSFALSPLYRIVCKVTGLNGGVNVAEISSSHSNTAAQDITIQFVATNNENLPWDFYPQKNSVLAHPEKTTRAFFYAKNNSSHPMTVQAIPSFAPAVAAKYFHKLECFCFRKQTLLPGESKVMPVVFQIDRALPYEIHVITLAYTLFAVNEKREST